MRNSASCTTYLTYHGEELVPVVRLCSIKGGGGKGNELVVAQIFVLVALTLGQQSVGGVKKYPRESQEDRMKHAHGRLTKTNENSSHHHRPKNAIREDTILGVKRHLQEDNSGKRLLFNGFDQVYETKKR